MQVFSSPWISISPLFWKVLSLVLTLRRVAAVPSWSLSNAGLGLFHITARKRFPSCSSEKSKLTYSDPVPSDLVKELLFGSPLILPRRATVFPVFSKDARVE